MVAIFLLRFVPQQFFPASDRPELTVDLTLRQNASIYATEAQVERLEAIIKADPDVDHFSAYVGRGAIRFILTLNVQLANPFFAQFVIVAKDLEARERLQQRLEQTLAEQFPDVVSRVSPLELGPPVGWPLQYRVSGPDQEEVRRIALDFANVLASDPRTRHVHFDWMEPARQVRVNVDQDEARRLGVSSRALAAVLNASVTGSTVTQLRDDIYLINVVARATDTRARIVRNVERAAGADADRPYGAAAAVRDVRRRTGVPARLAARPRADADRARRRRCMACCRILWLPRLRRKSPSSTQNCRTRIGSLPAVYTKKARPRVRPCYAVVPLMIVLMLSIMMLMLVSFRRLAMVVSLLPLGLIGVVMALLAFNRPLGFVAILGILALIGMIAKNAVILVVQIETDRAEGKSVIDAVMSAATSRMRPLMLTAISTVLGLIPIAPTVFWGPMAFAIMGGLLVATLLTLILLPVLYVTVFGNDPPPTATEPT